jgi:sorbitol-specific phosphotransferase system component IIC
MWEIIVLVIFAISVIGFVAMIKSGTVTDKELLPIGAWFFFASPVTYSISSYSIRFIDASKSYKEKLSTLTSHRPEMTFLTEYMPLELFHGFFLTFIPLVLAAIGTWALISYLDVNVKIVKENKDIR